MDTLNKLIEELETEITEMIGDHEPSFRVEYFQKLLKMAKDAKCEILKATSSN